MHRHGTCFDRVKTHEKMKRIVVSLAVLIMGAVIASAQSFDVKVAEDVPAEAAKVLQQRFTQMLQGEGFTVEEDAADVLEISATVQERMETPGSMSQSVVVLNIKARARGEEVVFTVKGVGKDDADAWLRAAKQVLPRSKQAQEFLAKLK